MNSSENAINLHPQGLMSQAGYIIPGKCEGCQFKHRRASCSWIEGCQFKHRQASCSWIEGVAETFSNALDECDDMPCSHMNKLRNVHELRTNGM